MGIFRKKKEESGKKPIKVVDVSGRANSKKKKDTMWCSMHSCSKLACPGGNHD